MTQEFSSGKRTAALVSALIMALVFAVSGGWKLLFPFQTGELLEQAQVPSGLGPLGASALGTLEVLTALLLVLPQFRRWGGLLGSALLVFFIAWIARYYHVLAGQECSCFPLIKRTVGPGFFISDAVMLALCVAAFAWSPLVRRFRVPAVLLVALIAMAGVSFGVSAAQRRGTEVPTPLVVNGKPQDLTHGKAFLFFYDPSCMHCDAAARYMSTLNWGNTRVVAIPTVNPQWAASFLHDTKLKADTSLELTKLKKKFPFVDPPFGVALQDGRSVETFGQKQFDPPLPGPELKKLAFAH